MEFDFTKEPGKILQKNRKIMGINKPLISVITAYFNANTYFEQLYNCMMNQTFPWFEWIIIDDGSTDVESIKLLKNVSTRDDRIRVIRKENGGLSSARNCGIKESVTEIVVPIDADDLIEPTFLEVLWWALYYNPDCTWAYTDSCGFQGQEYVWRKKFDAETLTHYNFLVATAAIRKKDLLEVGCYDEVEKHYYEDWRLWLKFLEKSKRPVKIESIEFWYRRSLEGMLNSINENDEAKKRADFLIHAVALKADVSVKAKEFVENSYEDRFMTPQHSSFKRKYERENRKVNILFLIPWMTVGGADRFNLDFVRLLDKEKYDITIVTTVASDNGWKQKFREYTSEVFCLPEFLDVKNYAEFISYIIQSRGIHVCLISNSYYGYYLIPWLRKEFPNVALIDYVHMEEMYWRAGGYGRTSMAMADILEKTYVCNHATRKNFIELFNRNPDEVETIHIGVDYEKYNPEIIPFGRIRKEFKISNKDKIVLFPCRLHSQKRPYLMLEIAKKVIKERKDIYFLVVGDGPEYATMKQQVETYKIGNRVLFAGARDNIQCFYRDSDVTLICSIKEGLSLTAYESCAMMTPVISADVGGQSDLIDHTVGKLIPCLQKEEDILQISYSEEEVSLYVNAILGLLALEYAEEYQKISIFCRERIMAYFGLDSMIKNMETAIQDCLSDERKKKRYDLSLALQRLPRFAEDMIGMYVAFESVEQDCGRSWNHCNYIENYKNEQIREKEQEIEQQKREQEEERKQKEVELQNIRIELNEVQQEKRFIEHEFDCMSHSWSFKAGRLITWGPRKIRGGYACMIEHGVVYTLKLFLKKAKLIRGM